ncbi:probable cytochrome P450 4ad1 [Musca vetustissima]|uniref:probable cytochrome P450 4ad1 n=1 Tax=Musca vetustissima TaxID=27455 RepID=UPI002AB7DBB9|nr:probable cytochrome P450 4ad1 [Musca vetustissima]
MEMFLLALAIVIFTVLFFKGIKIFNYLDHVAGIMEMIPGPTPYPFVGNLFQFGLKPDEYPKKILQYCRKYDFQGFRSLVFFQYHVMLSDPAEIQNMLSSSSLLYKEHLYSFLRPWLGDGLLTSSGARWLKHQKLYMPAFDNKAVEGYMKVVNKTGKKFANKLRQHAEDGEVFDIQEIVRKCTLDIVCENATGVPSNSLDDQPSNMHAAIADLCDVIQERTFSIVKRFDTLFYLTPYFSKQRKALRELKTEMNRIVEQRRRQLKDDAGKDLINKDELKPFLNVLLNAKLDGRELKFREIFEELSTFIFTGHDPTASALSFTLYTLSRHPAIQQQAFEEQKKIFADKQGQEFKDVEATIEDLQKMSYLEMVIRETLRLYPAVPLIARTNRKGIDINGTKIARRTTVIMCLIAMGYNERYFENPCEFKPERFANVNANDLEKKGIEAFKSVPFSAGPRKCIAERFAMFELKSLLSQVLRNYEILPAKDGLSSGINDHSRKGCVPESEYDPILNIRVTLKSENGILVRLKKRN